MVAATHLLALYPEQNRTPSLTTIVRTGQRQMATTSGHRFYRPHSQGNAFEWRVTQIAKSLAKRILPKKIVDKLRVLSYFIHEVPFDNQYWWLHYAFCRLIYNRRCAVRPQYIWGVAQGAALAKVLGTPRISVIEFGVAGGFGLIALENIAAAISQMTDIGIDVFGFDTGAGLPPPADFRDQPNLWYGGQLPMDQQKLLSRLKRAKLHIGPVKDTLVDFVNNQPSPVAFVSFDMDLYSSTRDALKIFEVGHAYLMPRVFSYFDDIFGYTFNDFCGERAAISEFNANHVNTKLCPIYGLKYFTPRMASADLWPDGMYISHLFDHKLYNSLDSIDKPVSAEIDGKVTWERPPPRLG